MLSIHRTVILLVGLTLLGCDLNPGQALTAPGARPSKDPADYLGLDQISLEIKGIPQANPIRPIVPWFPDVTPDVVLSPDVMQSVTGHYQFVGINTGNDFTYSLTGIRHEDGSVSGEFEERVVLNSTGEFIRQTHGTVTCFQIVGNTARIGGLVDQATDPRFLPGTEFRLVVVDNGDGASDPPDLGSNARFGFPGTAQAFCDTGTAFNLEPVEHGNVEVRP
jgi:hypothetical protein